MKNLLFILSLMLLFAVSSQAQGIYQQGFKAYNNENYKDAIDLLTKVIEANEGFIDAAYIYRGKSNQMLGKNNKALEDYNKAIETNPNNATAYFNRGCLRNSYLNDDDGSLKDLTMAIKLDSKYEQAYFERAALKYKMGDLKGALGDYNTILKYFNPNDELVKSYIANIQNKTGTVAQAKIGDNDTNASNTQTNDKITPTKPLIDYNTITTDITSTNNTTYSNENREEVKEDADLNVFWFSPNPDELPEKGMYAEDEMMTIKLKALSSHPLAANNFTIYINGKPAKSSKFNEVQLTGGPHHFTYINTVKLDPDLNFIKVEVKNDAGTKFSGELKVMYNPRKPDLHVLSIGPKAINLKYTQKDAENFADMFIGQAGPEENKIFANVYVKKLVGEAATTNEIRGMLEEYLYHQNVQPKDMMLLFVASHGFIDDGDFRIQGSDYNPIRRRSTSISFKDDVTTHLATIDCKKILFIDACHSGGARGDVMDINDAIKQVSQKQNINLTLTSSSQNQLSYEDDSWDNGAFTKALIDGMQRGKADTNGDKVVTVKELSDYVAISVKSMVRTLKNELQEPSFINDGSKGVGDNLPIYVIENFAKVISNQAIEIKDVEIKSEAIKKH